MTVPRTGHDVSRHENTLRIGFAYLENARPLNEREIAAISDDDAAILWLDGLVMNPDRTPRNPNFLWCYEGMWPINHGAALVFQYAWEAVTDESPRRPFLVWEPHLLHDREDVVCQWDELLAARLTRPTIEKAIAAVPDAFLEPLVRATGNDAAEAIARRPPG